MLGAKKADRVVYLNLLVKSETGSRKNRIIQIKRSEKKIEQNSIHLPRGTQDQINRKRPKDSGSTDFPTSRLSAVSSKVKNEATISEGSRV